MYLKNIRARNYRAFGDGATAPELNWELNPGLNILVGENDAGKTGIVDAIRQVLLTTSYEPVRLFEQDFHIEGKSRAQTLSIEATLCGLSPDQEASVLEWLTLGADGTCSITVPGDAASVSSSILPPVLAVFPSVPSAIPPVTAPQGTVVPSAQTPGHAGTAPVASVVPPSVSTGGTQGNGV